MRLLRKAKRALFVLIGLGATIVIVLATIAPGNDNVSVLLYFIPTVIISVLLVTIRQFLKPHSSSKSPDLHTSH